MIVFLLTGAGQLVHPFTKKNQSLPYRQGNAFGDTNQKIKFCLEFPKVESAREVGDLVKLQRAADKKQV